MDLGLSSVQLMKQGNQYTDLEISLLPDSRISTNCEAQEHEVKSQRKLPHPHRFSL